ncbi:flavin-containing monooxygenase [Acrocarpospora catenulata]|uniref:flavin-containing monooxygenase n=1 Tax=Acrocarpospora catenulata TaxID=2836182 RepID=UPI001BD9F421|nr:NAD(P)/FAD-dependent oxidoreductase [Acrocarpospora catenulata]
MTMVDETAPVVAEEVFSSWLREFETASWTGDPERLAACFLDDAYWRDILSFTWEYRTFAGRDAIVTALRAALPEVRPGEFRQAPGRSLPRLVKRSGRRVVEAFFEFETAVGRGHGFVRLPVEGAPPGGPRAWILLTTLHELRGFEEQIGERRPTGLEYSSNFSGDNWADQRRKEQEYADRDPEVLVVGGGQAGLILGARLRQIGVDALIVEKLDRIGDNWRQRYHSLTLHNEVWANSLPYVPFPPTWPTFVPKDKLAGFLEAYAEFMELNVWTGTEFRGATYDEGSRLWTAHLGRAGGTERVVRCPHIVLATGSVSGTPTIPSMPGLDDFAGEVVHSSRFTSGIEYRGRRAIVVGTGNSGHDVAQELHENGAAQVTMVQRGPTCVVSLIPSGTLVYSLFSEGPPVEDIDLITASIPYPVLKESYQRITRRTTEIDGELLRRLQAAGFEVDQGPDGTGFHMKYLRTGGGYYINVGCSDLIADGRIRVVQARDIVRFTRDGALLADGTTIESDLVVLATGYENQQEAVRRMFGDELADRIGPIWDFDEDGFMRNMWRRLDQDGFWLMGGSLIECRTFSRYLALAIKADLEGLLPPRPGRTALPPAASPADLARGEESVR